MVLTLDEHVMRAVGASYDAFNVPKGRKDGLSETPNDHESTASVLDRGTVRLNLAFYAMIISAGDDHGRGERLTSERDART